MLKCVFISNTGFFSFKMRDAFSMFDFKSGLLISCVNSYYEQHNCAIYKIITRCHWLNKIPQTGTLNRTEMDPPPRPGVKPKASQLLGKRSYWATSFSLPSAYTSLGDKYLIKFPRLSLNPLCSPGWTWTWGPPYLSSENLGWHACTTKPCQRYFQKSETQEWAGHAVSKGSWGYVPSCPPELLSCWHSWPPLGL